MTTILHGDSWWIVHDMVTRAGDLKSELDQPRHTKKSPSLNPDFTPTWIPLEQHHCVFLLKVANILIEMIR